MYFLSYGSPKLPQYFIGEISERSEQEKPQLWKDAFCKNYRTIIKKGSDFFFF